MKVTTPYERVTEVNNCRILSLYIQAGIGLGQIPYNLFNQKLTLGVGDKKDLVIQASSQTEATIKWVADNLRLVTTGTCFVAIDEALDEMLGEKPETYMDNDSDSLRAVIYMTRCAFAHNPASPVWQIKTKYRKVFKIKPINFEIDLRQLNGKALDYSHFGGFMYMHELILHSMAIIKKYNEEAITKQGATISTNN